MSDSEDFCRDYLRGNCSRGFKCKYKHPDAAEVAARAVSTGMDVGRTVFCRDFQKGMCTRENCKFVHATEAEELYYKLTGQMPPRLLAPNPPEVTPQSQLHQLMLNAYMTGDFTAYSHQLQVMGYPVAPMGPGGDAVGMHAMVPGYLHQQVGVPPSPGGGMAGPVPGGVPIHPSSYSPLPGMTPGYQPGYNRIHGSHGSVAMPPGTGRQPVPRRHSYGAPVMVSAGIQSPRLSTIPPFQSSPAPSPSVFSSPSSTRPTPPGSDLHRSTEPTLSLEPLASEVSANPPSPTSKPIHRNGTATTFTASGPNLLEDLQLKVDELEQRIRQLESENELLREENAKLKGQS